MILDDSLNFKIKSDFSYKKVKIPEKILNLIKEIKETLFLLEERGSPWFKSAAHWPPRGTATFGPAWYSDGTINENYAGSKNRSDFFDTKDPNSPLECTKEIISLILRAQIQKIISSQDQKYILKFQDCLPLIRFYPGAFIETQKKLQQEFQSDICCILQIEQKCKPWKIQISDIKNDWDEIELKDGEMLVYDQNNCLFGRIDPLEKSIAENYSKSSHNQNTKAHAQNQTYSDQMFFYFKYLKIK